MKLSQVLFIIAAVGILAMITGCDKIAAIKGSVSGTVYRGGRPLMGQIQVVDPNNFGSIKTEPVNNQGHFIISDVPPGEWLLSFLGPTSQPLGEYKYIKISPGRPLTDLTFEITEKDPQVQVLLDKIKAGGTGGATGGAKPGATPPKPAPGAAGEGGE